MIQLFLRALMTCQVAGLLVVGLMVPQAYGQEDAQEFRGMLAAPQQAAPQQAAAQPMGDVLETGLYDGRTVRMNLQGKVPLDALVGYLSKRLNIQFQYDDAIAARQVTIRTPEQIPIQSLMTLLGNVLRTEGLALIDSDRKGWKRIVEVSEMAPLATIRRLAPTQAQNQFADMAAQNAEPANGATPITQVFVLQNLSASSVAEALKPFVSGEGASLTAVTESNTLIVTDYAASINKLSDLIRLVDQPAGRTELVMYEVQHQSAERLAKQVESLMTAAATKDSKVSLTIVPQPLGKRIMIAGTTDLVAQTQQVLQRLDVALGVSTEVYRIRNTTAARVDRLIGGFIEPPNDSEMAFQSTVDEEGNLLIVRAREDVHRQIVDLIKQLDSQVDTNESPIQFYKLKNASAIDVLYSLLALQEAVGTGAVNNAGFYGALGGVSQAGYPTNGLPGFFNPAMGNAGGLQAGNAANNQFTQLPLTPTNNRGALVQQPTNPLARPTLATGRSLASGRSSTQSGLGQQFGAGNGVGGAANQLAGGFGGGLGGGAGGGGVASLPGGARVSADVSTNSLIVYAPSNVQPMYAKLIKSLDQRRPQVLIEAKVIAVSTTDNYTLGVEVSAGDRSGAKRLFKFSSFGLSEVNATTGALTITPGLGFNGALIDPEIADVVVRALAQHDRSRVLAAPKILVNDNSTGTLESVVSVPFSSINAADTVATTSLGGAQTAGTVITVTPHINEDDHLQLEFDVEFSTFEGTGADGLPPPRQIDRVGSIVTIPNGKTVVVGGLKRVSESSEFSGIPWAERIPVIRELTSRTDDARTTTSFFLFIRPIVLRDSRFADLQYLSDNNLDDIQEVGDLPASRPELIH